MDKMVYKDYLNAARKHKYTCSVLLGKLDQINEVKEPAKANYLLLTIYYLSGYIIECVVKYGIYNLIGFSKTEDVKNLNQKRLNYKNDICHHKFNRFTQHLNCRIGISLPLIRDTRNIDKNVIELYNKWDAPVRYFYKLNQYKKREYIEFNRLAEDILNKIIINVRG